MSENQLHRNILENIYDGVYFVDKDRKITFWNKGAERISGYRAEEVVGTHCYDNLLNHVTETGIELCRYGCPLVDTIQDGKMRKADVFLRHKEGHRVPVSIRAIAIEDNGKVIGAVETFTDETDRCKWMEELKKQALCDQLTGLFNRRYIDSYLESKEREFRQLGIPFGLAFADLDYFTKINNQYGHDAGDKVLQMVARTMRDAVRGIDMVGRWGGEEFLMVLPGVDSEQLCAVMNKICHLIEKSVVHYMGEQISVTISIGTAHYQEDDTVASLLKRADENLYCSKESGRNRVTCEQE